MWPPEGGWGPVTLLGQGGVRAGQQQRDTQRQPSRSLAHRAGAVGLVPGCTAAVVGATVPNTCFCDMVGELLPAFRGCRSSLLMLTERALPFIITVLTAQKCSLSCRGPENCAVTHVRDPSLTRLPSKPQWDTSGKDGGNQCAAQVKTWILPGHGMLPISHFHKLTVAVNDKHSSF